MSSSKKALIATRNIDKYTLVTLMLKNSICPDYQFEYLESIDEEIVDVKETGDVLNRALQKAKNAFLNIKDNDYDLIVGVDDGILIKNKMIENVKEIIKPILENTFLEEGEIIYLVKAFSFINKNGNKKSFVCEVPFKYQKLEEKVSIKKNTYPLNNVFVPIGMKETLTEMDDALDTKYFLKYSFDKLNDVKEILL